MAKKDLKKKLEQFECSSCGSKKFEAYHDNSEFGHGIVLIVCLVCNKETKLVSRIVVEDSH